MGIVCKLSLQQRLDCFARYLTQAYECDPIELIETAAWLYSADAMQQHLRRGRCSGAPMVIAARTALDVARAQVNKLLVCLEQTGTNESFLGLARSERDEFAAVVAVLAPKNAPCFESAPGEYRVLAVVPTYNEEDIIGQTLQYLISQGIEVHLLDNWSTDATVERAAAFEGRGLQRIERFPQDGPARTYDLEQILRRVEEISAHSTWAHWVMLHDADERRSSPWRGMTLRDALWHVERSGFSCIDHVTLNFWPTDDSFLPERSELEAHFRYFEFSNHPGHFHQRRVWRRCGEKVTLAASAGHDVAFAGRRVYPYKFLLKHYPIRSRAHGERKVLLERVRRWNLHERALGWHRQYDELPTDGFIRDARSLLCFDPTSFATDYLLERLAGVGVYERPPPWASAPSW